MITEEEKELAMKTARGKGAVGKNAVVPIIVDRLLSQLSGGRALWVLDFGCGKDQQHVKALKEKYPHDRIRGYDFSIPKSEWNLNVPHDIVYLSNVINVQTSLTMLHETLQQVKQATSDDGEVIMNYPHPRKMNLSPSALHQILQLYFHEVDRLPYPNYVVFTMRGKKNVNPT